MNRKNFKSSFKRFLKSDNDNHAVGTFETLDDSNDVAEHYGEAYIESEAVNEEDNENVSVSTYIGEDNFMMENEFNNTPTVREVSIISKGLVVEGNINTEGDIDIRGDINGNVSSEGVVRIYGSVNGDIKAKLVICDGGTVIGNSVEAIDNIEVKQGSVVTSECHCTDIVVDGKVDGNSKLSGKCILKSNAHYSGNINTDDIVIEPGAKFTGSVSN